MIERTWSIHESPGVKPDWLSEIKLFSVKTQTFYQIATSQGFFKLWKVMILAGSFFLIFVCLPCNELEPH